MLSRPMNDRRLHLYLIRFVVDVCLSIGLAVGEGRDPPTHHEHELTAEYRNRPLGSLVLPGVDTDTVFCGAANHPFGRKEPILDFVDAGYRFFDLSVERHKDDLLYWSISGLTASDRRRRREVLRDLKQIAAAASRYRSEVFFLRFTVIENSMMKSRDSRLASARLLMRTLRQEFDFRLDRSSFTLTADTRVSEILAGGSNVIIFIKGLKDFVTAADDDINRSDILHLRELFIPDDVLSDTVDVDGDDLQDRADTILRRHKTIRSLTQLILRVPDSVNHSNSVAKSANVVRLVFGLLPVCMVVVVVVASVIRRQLIFCQRRLAGPKLSSTLHSVDVDQKPWRRSGTAVVDLTAITVQLLLPPSISRRIFVLGMVLLLTALALLTKTRNDVAIHQDNGGIDGDVTGWRLVSDCRTEVVISSLVGRWLSRPSLYRVNIISVVIEQRWQSGAHCPNFQCMLGSNRNSSITRLANLANSDLICRKVSLVHTGSPLTGSVGLRSLFVCPPVIFAYIVVSRDEGRVVAWNQLTETESRDFEEAEFPMDSSVIVYVGTVWNKWLQVYSANLQHLIESGRDVYLRGTESRGGVGLVYVSHTRRHLAATCRSGPSSSDGLLNVTHWDDRIVTPGSNN